MTPAETADVLRQFNEWRIGDEDLPQPDTFKITRAIYSAVDLIEAADEDRALCDKLSSILQRTANALKGDPKPLHRHSWHDLPEVARRIVEEVDEIDRLRAQNTIMTDAINAASALMASAPAWHQMHREAIEQLQQVRKEVEQ